MSWQVTHSRFLYSQFECSGNTFLAINSELLADAVWQTWPSAMGRRAIFLQKFLKGENLKFMLVIWESILRDQTEFKTFFTVPQMLAMMVDLEEDEDWANADELADDDFDR